MAVHYDVSVRSASGRIEITTRDASRGLCVADRRRAADDIGDLTEIDDVFDEQVRVSVTGGGDVRDPYPGFAARAAKAPSARA